nr:MAG TPA: YopX protein [Caudoviricetes sp.]
MREIEFRVWDNLRRVYLNKKDIAIDNLGNIFVFEGCDDNDADLWHVRILSDPYNGRYVIEQTTGLADKNDTEIYEGDVVKYGELTYFVKYRLSRFMLCAPHKMSICLSELTYDCDTNQLNCEVVGNIHENPKLLEEK